MINIWTFGKLTIQQKKQTISIVKNIVKKFLIAKKTFNTKESFQCFYRKVIPLPEILIDAVYRKDENYYPKVFLEKKSSILMILMIVMKKILTKSDHQAS